MTTNTKIVDIFSNIASLLEILDENPFKIRAYKKAINSINELSTDLREYSQKNDLTDINGIGKDLGKKIEEFINTGKIEYYENLKTKVPLELISLLNIQGVGPKFLSTVFKKFNIKNIDDFEKAINSAEIENLKGVGKKKLDEIQKGISLYKEHLNKINICIAYPLADFLKNVTSELKGVDRVDIAGSVRRMKETVNNINLVVKTSNKNFLKSFSNLPFIKEVKKLNSSEGVFTLNQEVNVKIKIFNEDSYFLGLLYETGSKKHNDKISEVAKQKKIELSEKSLLKNGKPLTVKSEDELYKNLSLEFIPPELRENTGEIEASEHSKLPSLVELRDIKGDLHTHSTWSDGKSSIEEMAMAAIDLGYEYIAITDHSPSSTVANGLQVKRLKEKKAELQKIDKKLDKIKILMGSEVDIKPDGSLDYPDEILKELDMVVASVHSNFKMDKSSMTKRLVSALKNPYVCALGHPTGRLIGQREPYEVDIDKIIETAKEYGKALEINSSYLRLDLKDLHAKKAIENGVKLIISTDAHHIDQLNQMVYGIGTARRGWVEKGDVINTYGLKKLTKWLESFK